MKKHFGFAVAALAGLYLNPHALVGQQTGRVELNVREGDRAVPCRIHLYDAAGKTPKVAGWPAWNDHIVCDANGRFDLPAGKYRTEIERGPEYNSAAGELTVTAGQSQILFAELKRLVDMKAEGWWSGELHVHRPLDDVPLLMQAEDLHFAPIITWWNKRNLWSGREIPANPLVQLEGRHFYEVMGGEDEREGGALLYYGLKKPLSITDAEREYPSPMKFLRQAREQPGIHVDIEKPFWWDVPVWIASGQADTIGIANNHMARSRMYPGEAWGKARDAGRLPEPHGNGYWTQEIYYHLLNCGLRIAPSAGSASGVLPNPVGYNRVYVHLEGEPTWETWFAGLRAGRSFVTNGPLLRIKAAGQYPGHVFKSADALKIELTGLIDGRDRDEEIEIIRDGRIERKVSYAEFARIPSLGQLSFTSSGWFLVRAVSANRKTFRFASTAPWHVEVGTTPRRISRASVRFFIDWVNERIDRVKLADDSKREEVLEPHRQAREYWTNLLQKVTAE